MSEDRQTLDVYDAQAAEYEARVAAKSTPGLDHDLSVDAIDGSNAMVKRARDHGVPARKVLFHQIAGRSLYDGLFANFSLLHLPRADMLAMLARLNNLLKPKGLLHIGLKLGTGEARDYLGRFYTYYQQDELEGLLTSAGFTPITHILGAGAGLDGRTSDWIVIHARS